MKYSDLKIYQIIKSDNDEYQVKDFSHNWVKIISLNGPREGREVLIHSLDSFEVVEIKPIIELPVIEPIQELKPIEPEVIQPVLEVIDLPEPRFKRALRFFKGILGK